MCMERGVGDARQDQENNFEPHPLLRNPHVATAVAACWQRTVSPQHVEERLFEVIVTALDDPFIPFESFHHPAIVGNRSIALVAPEHGGHCAFISRNSVRERFWAESRVVEFCAEHSEIVKYTGPHSKSGDLLTPRNAHQSRARQGAHKFQPRKPFVVFPLLVV